MFQGDKLEKKKKKGDTEEFEGDNDFNGTCPNKINMIPRPKRALKLLRN